jgi:hypothetical protein
MTSAVLRADSAEAERSAPAVCRDARTNLGMGRTPRIVAPARRFLNPNGRPETLTCRNQPPSMYLNQNLIIVFVFIVVLIAIKRYFQWKRHQAWHETARLALEKGQPLPPGAPGTYIDLQPLARHRDQGACDLRGGLVAIAVGAGMYYAMPGDTRMFGAIPAFVGVALLISGLFRILFADKSSGPRDPSNPA